jgi:hypothetical protein
MRREREEQRGEIERLFGQLELTEKEVASIRKEKEEEGGELLARVETLAAEVAAVLPTPCTLNPVP